jgi:hypothetical protein
LGRLENIIARNQPGRRPREKVVVSIVFGAIVLLILALMVFTDLGLPPDDPADDRAPVVAPSHDKRVDGVHLWKQPTRPAAPAKR